MRPLILSSLLIASAALAQTPFQLVVTVSPPNNQTNPANWTPTKRFDFTGVPAAAPGTFADLPVTEVFDPAGVAFKSAQSLFIGNRHGNALGQGSVSQFQLSASGATATFVRNFTQPGLIGVHEITFSPTTGELFCAAVYDGIYRFTFNSSGVPTPSGHFAAGIPMRGVWVHPNGRFVYTTSFGSVIRCWELVGSSVIERTSLSPPGASNLHFFGLRPGGQEVVACDISSNKVFRYAIQPGGTLSYISSVTSPGAIDAAFNADGTEMFVGDHFAGGIHRFSYSAGTNSWTEIAVIATPSMGGFGSWVQPPCGAADLGKQGGIPGADGFLDNNDFVVFIDYFFQGNMLADYGSQGGLLGADTMLDNNDFVVFIDLFFNSCA